MNIFIFTTAYAAHFLSVSTSGLQQKQEIHAWHAEYTNNTPEKKNPTMNYKNLGFFDS